MLFVHLLIKIGFHEYKVYTMTSYKIQDLKPEKAQWEAQHPFVITMYDSMSTLVQIVWCTLNKLRNAYGLFKKFINHTHSRYQKTTSKAA